MIGKVVDFFNQHLRVAENEAVDEGSQQVFHLATASLMIEVMRADFDVSDIEQQRVVEIIQQRLDLSKQQTDELLVLAEQEVTDSVSLYQFTGLIDKEYTYEQKVQILAMLWEVVFADAKMDKHEEYVVRKIADLLHIRHQDYIETRHNAEPK